MTGQPVQIAGIVLLWRFAASRTSSEEAEKRVQKLIALSFYLIAAYVGFETVPVAPRRRPA